MVAPHTFFEALGVRYAGPIDGHDIEHDGAGLRPRRRVGRPDRRPRPDPEGPGLRPGRRGRHPAPPRRQGHQAGRAREHGRAARPGAAVGGSAGVRRRRRRLARARPRRPTSTQSPRRAATYTDAFTRALLAAAEEDPRIVALTAAMPGPTGLLRLPGPLPRPLLRRRHRRAARGHLGGRHGHGRPAARWWRSTRPSSAEPSTRPTSTSACTAARWSSCSTGPASPATTGRATTASSTWPWPRPSPA